MPLELFALYSRQPVFALVAGRLGGLIMFLPMFGGMAIPARVRAMLVVGLAALVTPLVRVGPDAPTNLIGIALALANEVLSDTLDNRRLLARAWEQARDRDRALDAWREVAQRSKAGGDWQRLALLANGWGRLELAQEAMQQARRRGAEIDPHWLSTR